LAITYRQFGYFHFFKPSFATGAIIGACCGWADFASASGVDFKNGRERTEQHIVKAYDRNSRKHSPSFLVILPVIARTTNRCQFIFNLSYFFS